LPQRFLQIRHFISFALFGAFVARASVWSESVVTLFISNTPKNRFGYELASTFLTFRKRIRAGR
jgi:hypothetical protein